MSVLALSFVTRYLWHWYLWHCDIVNGDLFVPEISHWHYSSKFQGPLRTIEADAIIPTHVKKKKKEWGRREEKEEEEEEEEEEEGEDIKSRRELRRKKKKKELGGKNWEEEEGEQRKLFSFLSFFSFSVIYSCRPKLAGMTKTRRNGPKFFPRWNKGVSRSGFPVCTLVRDFSAVLAGTERYIQLWFQVQVIGVLHK